MPPLKRKYVQPSQLTSANNTAHDVDKVTEEKEDNEWLDTEFQEESSDDESDDVEELSEIEESLNGEEDDSDEGEADSDEVEEEDEDDEDNENVDSSEEYTQDEPVTDSKREEKKFGPEENGNQDKKTNTNLKKKRVLSVDKKKLSKVKGKPENGKFLDVDQPSTSGGNDQKTDSDSFKQQQKMDEYKSDSSDEEDIRNTVGNIPMNWYDDYPHLGYDWDGKKIFKPNKMDQLDEFLKRMEDPNFWRSVMDKQTGQNVILSDADVDLIERMQKGKIPDGEFDEYAPWVEWFSSKVMETPLRKFPEHKRSFLPSKSEKDKVSKLVHALKMGWIKPESERKKEAEEKAEKTKFYMLWKTDGESEHMRRIHKHITAPKRLLPGHAESYNPPPEYLFDKREMKLWNKQSKTPWKRKLHFVPQKFNSLREVPSYSRYIKERFQRCLDLYLCPRAIKMKLTIQPEDLVPQLPSPQDLQPFPTTLSLVYKGHTDMIRTITIDPRGQYLASGSDDMTVKVWEVSTGRCLKTINSGGVVRSVSWCPNQALSLLLIAADRKLLVVNPGVGDSLVMSKTDSILEESPPQDVVVPERVKSAVQWESVDTASEEWCNGIRIIINHFKEIKQVTWHGRGDYFATVMTEGQNRSVMIHQLSKRRSQVPFNKSKGLVQCVLFHPVRPFLFVATQRHVRIYDLVKQEIMKKLMSNSKWISTMAIHPGGDNILVGTYDRKMLWFDLDLSTKPYQSLRLHGTAVRGVAYHKRYPLFASGSDDKNVIVSHGMVYNDLLKNPLIVPLKKLSYHESYQDFGVFDVLFHPTQPWLFSSGADATIRLYS